MPRTRAFPLQSEKKVHARGLVPGRASSLQFFLLLGAQLLLNRLTLLAEAMETEGDSSFTLSRRVFLMAAGETFS